MPDEIQPGSPAHEALRTEYGEALKSGDQAKIEAAGAKYSQLAGGKQQLDLGGKGATAGPAPGEEGRTDLQAVDWDALKADPDFGPNMEANLAEIQAFVPTLFEGMSEPEANQLFDNIASAYFAAGGDGVGATKLLLRMARLGKR